MVITSNNGEVVRSLVELELPCLAPRSSLIGLNHPIGNESSEILTIATLLRRTVVLVASPQLLLIISSGSLGLSPPDLKFFSPFFFLLFAKLIFDKLKKLSALFTSINVIYLRQLK